jgi:hypothetical protein
MEGKRVAIIFYGLAKNISRTIVSIKENVFKPLENASINYDIFIHTYKIYGPYTNVWAGENLENYDNQDIESILKPKYVVYDNQEDVINTIDFNEYYHNLGNWTGMTEELTKYLIKNLCLALYSKRAITNVFETHKDNYEYAIIVRPDLLIKNKIDIEWFNELNETNIIVPSTQWFHGCNDRFCMAKTNVILSYGKLFNELKEYSERIPIISERYLQDKMNEKGIQVIGKNIDYDTIRFHSP